MYAQTACIQSGTWVGFIMWALGGSEMTKAVPPVLLKKHAFVSLPQLSVITVVSHIHQREVHGFLSEAALQSDGSVI